MAGIRRRRKWLQYGMTRAIYTALVVDVVKMS